MSALTKAVSVRLPEPLLREASSLRPNAKVSEMVVEAFVAWVHEIRRQYEDDLIRSALAATSLQQRRDERELVEMAGRSSLRAMERGHG
jgi:hypothetical protein